MNILYQKLINIAMLNYALATELIEKYNKGAYTQEEFERILEIETFKITAQMETFMRKESKSYLPLLGISKYTPSLSASDWNDALIKSGYFFKAVGQGKALKRYTKCMIGTDNLSARKSS